MRPNAWGRGQGRGQNLEVEAEGKAKFKKAEQNSLLIDYLT